MKRAGKKVLGIILALALVLAPTTALAEGDEGGTSVAPNGCTAHTQHSDECGWAETVDESPCAHECSAESCGYIAAVEGANCTFEHAHELDNDDACGFDGEYEESCTFDPAAHAHDEDCGYREAVEGAACSHAHDEECGFAEAAPAVPCAHACGECAAQGVPAIRATNVGIQAGMLGTIALGTASDTPTVIAFAGREWVVVGYDGNGIYSTAGDGTVTLLLKSGSVGSPYYSIPFRGDGSTNAYRGSDLQNDIARIWAGFPQKEQALINARDIPGGAIYNDGSNGVAGSNVDDQLLWPLSVAEAGMLQNSVRVFLQYPTDIERPWWLRSPGAFDGSAAYVNFDGAVIPNGIIVDRNYAIRPAFNLNLASVLFTSNASGASAKSSATAGGGLVGAQAPAGAVKLTVLDAYAAGTNETGQALNVTMNAQQEGQTATAVSTLEFGYNSATTGANQYVSCVLVDASDEVAYYGKLADCATSGSGTLSIPLSGVANGSYTLKLFSEQANADYYTDFASEPVAMTVNVTDGAGTVSGFSGTILSNNAELSTVAGKTITAGNEAGTQAAPKTAAVTVDNSISQIAVADIVPANTNATVELYSDSGFSQNKNLPVNLNVGGDNHLYIKVVSEDSSTTFYYDVTVTREDLTQPGTAPAITTQSLPGGTVGQSYSAQLAATGDAPIIWSLQSGALPGGLTLSQSGLVSGTPTAAGTFSVTLKAANGVLPDAVKTFGITIAAADVSTPTPPDPDSTPQYTRRTLTDAATGVTLTGSFTADAALVVTQNRLHAAGACAACDEIRAAGNPVALYDISITGGHSGNMEVCIPVPGGYNGRQMAVWHCKRDHVEKATLTASGGAVTGSFSSLSPFAVFAAGSGGNPQTGDTSNMGLWVALMAASLAGLGSIGAVLWRRRKRRGAGSKE